MKYVYYQSQGGDISMISPTIDPTSSDPYIVVSDAAADQFLSGDLLIHDYYVLPDKILEGGGTFKKKYRPTINQPRVAVSSKIYSIPLCTEPMDFAIVQDCVTKTIKVSLSKQAAHWWKENNFFNQSTVYIIACMPNDPHLVLWDWIIPSDKLKETPIIRSYATAWGSATTNEISDPLMVVASDASDQIRFYTRKIFESYSHEQLN
jgi:hypothetical protein